MPRQRNHHGRRTEDFPERLKRFQQESGLSRSEIADRLWIYRHTVWRWAEGSVRPTHLDASIRRKWHVREVNTAPGAVEQTRIYGFA